MGKSGDVTLKRAATRRETDLVIGDHIGVRILRDGDGVGRVIGNPESLDCAATSAGQAIAGSDNVEAARKSSAVNANAWLAAYPCCVVPSICIGRAMKSVSVSVILISLALGGRLKVML